MNWPAAWRPVSYTHLDVYKRQAQELVKSEVVAVIGTTTTVMTKAIMPTLEAAKVVQISPTASATDLYGKDDYLFRINWTCLLYTSRCV